MIFHADPEVAGVSKNPRRRRVDVNINQLDEIIESTREKTLDDQERQTLGCRNLMTRSLTAECAGGRGDGGGRRWGGHVSAALQPVLEGMSRRWARYARKSGHGGAMRGLGVPPRQAGSQSSQPGGTWESSTSGSAGAGVAGAAGTSGGRGAPPLRPTAPYVTGAVDGTGAGGGRGGCPPSRRCARRRTSSARSMMARVRVITLPQDGQSSGSLLQVRRTSRAHLVRRDLSGEAGSSGAGSRLFSRRPKAFAKWP